MGLFSRRKAAVAEVSTWETVWDKPGDAAGDDADMDDDGQATDLGYRAYMVAFRNEAAPDALITVWTYAVFAGEEQYAIGLRYQYTAGDQENWEYTGYHDDPEREVFDDIVTADADAREWAVSLADGSTESVANLPDVFEWDGEPFPVGDPG